MRSRPLRHFRDCCLFYECIPLYTPVYPWVLHGRTLIDKVSTFLEDKVFAFLKDNVIFIEQKAKLFETVLHFWIFHASSGFFLLKVEMIALALM